MEKPEIETRMYSALQQHVSYLMAMTVIDWAFDTGKVSERERIRLANRMEQRYNICGSA